MKFISWLIIFIAFLSLSIVGCNRQTIPTIVDTLPTSPIPNLANTPSLFASPTPPIPNPSNTPSLSASPTQIPLPWASLDLRGQLILVANSIGEMYLTYADGSGIQPILDDYRPGYGPSYAWSPDGMKIAYTVTNGGLKILDIATGAVVEYAGDGSNAYYPVWHPQGHMLAIPVGNDIQLINADLGLPLDLIVHVENSVQPQLAFSPDGSRMAVSGQTTAIKVYAMNIDSVTGIATSLEETEVISFDELRPWTMQWSPDGSMLAFYASTYVGVNYGLYVMDMSNLIPYRLTPAKYENAISFRWHPNGRKLALIGSGSGNWSIFLVNIDGSGWIDLMANVPPCTYGWSTIALDWSPDGDQLLFSHCGGLVLVDENGLNPIRIGVEQNAGDGLFRSVPGDLWISACAEGYSRLQIGGYAIVSPGDPNRVRSEPKKGDNLIGTLAAGTVGKVLEGPVCADGLVYWKVENDTIPGGSGWTAEGDGTNYWLEPYQP